MGYPARLREPATDVEGTAGRKNRVGLLSGAIPKELVYAFGCTPVRVFPAAEKPTAAEAYLPNNFCALTRLVLVSFVEGADGALDAVIFSDEDDATRRLHDVWRAHVPVPVWGFVEVPRATTPTAVRRYAGNLARLAGELERLTGRTLTATALREAIALYNDQRALLAELKRRWLDGIITTATYRRLRRQALTADPITVAEQMRLMLAEIDAMDEDSGFESSSAGHGLLLLAELAAPESLVRLIEGLGARVRAEDSDLDERDLARTVPTELETVEEFVWALARAYLTRPPAPRMRDLARRLDYLTQLVLGRHIQAAICIYNKFCDLFLAEFPILKKHFEGLHIPVLLIEMEDEMLGGQQRTRIEAFLETVSQR
jgi:benzoyl-CoA reductase/2-hydroxyglutaryl-CoA dehydratase subunit BcrC/BadD/HgdB